MGSSAPQIQAITTDLTPDERAELLEEFEGLGIDEVRRNVFRQTWSGDKLQVAREWIEEADAREWQASTGDSSRKRRWMGYATVAVGALYMLLRVMGIMKFGI